MAQPPLVDPKMVELAQMMLRQQGQGQPQAAPQQGQAGGMDIRSIIRQLLGPAGASAPMGVAGVPRGVEIPQELPSVDANDYGGPHEYLLEDDLELPVDENVGQVPHGYGDTNMYKSQTAKPLAKSTMDRPVDMPTARGYRRDALDQEGRTYGKMSTESSGRVSRRERVVPLRENAVQTKFPREGADEAESEVDNAIEYIGGPKDPKLRRTETSERRLQDEGRFGEPINEQGQPITGNDGWPQAKPERVPTPRSRPQESDEDNPLPRNEDEAILNHVAKNIGEDAPAPRAKGRKDVGDWGRSWQGQGSPAAMDIQYLIENMSDPRVTKAFSEQFGQEMLQRVTNAQVDTRHDYKGW